MKFLSARQKKIGVELKYFLTSLGVIFSMKICYEKLTVKATNVITNNVTLFEK